MRDDQRNIGEKSAVRDVVVLSWGEGLISTLSGQKEEREAGEIDTCSEDDSAYVPW